MQIIECSVLTDKEKESIFNLWNNEYPANISYTDISQLDAYLDNLSEAKHYFLQDGESTIGWAFTFIRDNEKWFAIIIGRTEQGKGYGSILLNKLKEHETTLNGWVTDHDRYKKADNSPYVSPRVFYQKNDFVLMPSVRLETEKLSTMKIRWSKDPLV